MIDIQVRQLRHRYDDRMALGGVDLRIQSGELYAIVGPNGGGKTTLFRVLATLIPPQDGEVLICGMSVRTQLFDVRRQLGVVFQSPAVDPKLSIDENLSQQGALYGLRGSELRRRKDEVLAKLGLESRRKERTETLSGGLRRRVDVAKGLLTQPRVLLLDEPSTGVDPGARRDLWEYLQRMRDQSGTTILLTTHLLEEADQAERVGILDRGKLVAEGNPADLKAELGSEWVVVETSSPQLLCQELSVKHRWEATIIDGRVRLDVPEARACVDELLRDYGAQIRSVSLGKPTLEEVFIKKTGHRYWQPQEPTTC